MRAAVGRLPVAPGVYRFRDERGRALYIGRATALRHRVASYWSDLRDRRHLRRMVPQIVRVEAIVCDSVHEAAWLERNLLERSRPRWNRVVGGAEEAMCIRVEHKGGAPRLAAVYWPVADTEHTFGPYLGGTRTRLAVAAFDRVLPLWATDERLAGFSRDLARVRGVVADDRERFLTTVTSALQRQGDAVRTVLDLLARQRDRASANLAFEHAARIQSEIEAIGWIAAEQKVTGLAPGPDADAHGWHAGVLVGFRVRGGRLSEWTQRACGERAAQPHLDRTPRLWAEFARRNAELAASIDER